MSAPKAGDVARITTDIRSGIRNNLIFAAGTQVVVAGTRERDGRVAWVFVTAITGGTQFAIHPSEIEVVEVTA